MEQDNFLASDAVMRWHKYTSLRPGFVGYLLQLVRERTNSSEEEQQLEFGIDQQTFLHLQAMPLPRPAQISKDAYRIAETLKLENPIAFVRAMILGSKMEKSVTPFASQDYYQAAFDEEDDLDQIPQED
jgi:hypothetical protein